MKIAQQTFDQFTEDIKDILKENLFEIVIHGSYALSDFNANRGDLDYLVVTNRNLDEGINSKLFELHEKYRSKRCLLLHQLEGTFYPKHFLEALEGQFIGCYIGTSRIGWKSLSTLHNSYIDLRHINEHGIKLLNKNVRIYNPSEPEILKEQKADLKAFKNSVKLSSDSEVGLWISTMQWCSRTLLYLANRKIGSKTDACRWCIQQPELEAFKSSFQEVEYLRSPYKETRIPEKAKDTCFALLGFVDNILHDTN
ncbi:MAG: nucleotidyltransferase domain-containing protein [Candidatus Aegiribacteria sp.]|nr:nucleotidyltransferase domain-containing protein [Candidatus Aegiribacteria sp.]